MPRNGILTPSSGVSDTEHPSSVLSYRFDPCTPNPDRSLVPCFSSLEKIRAEEMVVFRKTIIPLNVGRLLGHDCCVQSGMARTVELRTSQRETHNVLQTARSAQKDPGPKFCPYTTPPTRLKGQGRPTSKEVPRPLTPSDHTPSHDSQLPALPTQPGAHPALGGAQPAGTANGRRH